jgi:CRISPR-associated protein Cmr3
LLVKLKDDGQIDKFLLPSPADCLLLQKNDAQKFDKKADFIRLFPIEIPDVESNLNELLLVGTNQTKLKGKPYSELKYWFWDKLENWLLKGGNSEGSEISNYGIGELKKDSRTHVAINENFASDEGNLFQTRGLEFNYSDPKKAIDLEKVKKLALVVFVDDANSKKLENKGKLAPLGGERRLVTWRKDKTQQIQTCPDEIKKRIVSEKHCRLMLLTPAYFTDGLPKSNNDYDVKAIACNRYQTVSGWDFDINQPKPTRRLLPAGSILFLDLQNNKDIGSWIDKTWFSCISDKDAKTNQDFAKDGFGLSVLGTWDGNVLDKWSDE